MLQFIRYHSNKRLLDAFFKKGAPYLLALVKCTLPRVSVSRILCALYWCSPCAATAVWKALPCNLPLV